MQIPKSQIFFSAVLILFLFRVAPASTHMNPACIIKTKMAQIKIHKRSIEIVGFIVSHLSTGFPYDNANICLGAVLMHSGVSEPYVFRNIFKANKFLYIVGTRWFGSRINYRARPFNEVGRPG